MYRSAVNRPLFSLPRILWLCGVCVGLLGALPSCGGGEPVRVFVLAGQSNMEGQAVSDLSGKDYNEGRGTLVDLIADPVRGSRFAMLCTKEGKWRVRDDVWCSYQRENQPLLAGPLTIGFSVYGDPHHFGPELMFGEVLGDHFEGPILLIKTAWGGKSLYEDFRPPSAGGIPGVYYQKMIAEIRQTIRELDERLPVLENQADGVVLAGFVWYHGWNDGVDPERGVKEYKTNLIHLIRDVRRDLEVPDLPVVVGELTGPWVDPPEPWKTLCQAQADAVAEPEFAGNVRFVPTRPFVRAAEDSPNPTHGHHEFGNAETALLVGEALGQGMVELLTGEGPAERPENRVREGGSVAGDHPRTPRKLEGWEVLVDDRLAREEHRELGERAVRFLEAKLFEIAVVMPQERLAELRRVRIVLDLECGGLQPMQYHPSAQWLRGNGYAASLERCVHLPVAADVATSRNINEQPWVILHELAHAYHDQVLGFEEPRIIRAYAQYQESGAGEDVVRFDGERERHYALTDPKEFFAEMTEAYFGVNDFYPFNRAELRGAQPELYQLLEEIWRGAR